MPPFLFKHAPELFRNELGKQRLVLVFHDEAANSVTTETGLKISLTKLRSEAKAKIENRSESEKIIFF